MLMLADVPSRRTWGYPAKEKSDFPRLLRRWHEEVASKLNDGCKLSLIHFHSDSAAEFQSVEVRKLLDSWGTRQTTSPVDTPELYGVIEEINGVVYGMAFAFILAAGLPSIFC